MRVQAPSARSGSGSGSESESGLSRCFPVFSKGPAPAAQRGIWHPSGLSALGAKGCVPSAQGGRRLAVRTAMDHPIGALPRTPFPASRDFPSRGNEGYGEKNRRVIYFIYHSGAFPLWWLAPPPFPRSSVGRQKESALMGRLGALLRPTWRSYAGPPQWHYNPCLL